MEMYTCLKNEEIVSLFNCYLDQEVDHTRLKKFYLVEMIGSYLDCPET